MGQVLHKCAKTTEKVRYEIQNSKESIKKLAIKFNIQSVPVTIFIGKDGKEKGRIEGNFEWHDDVIRKIVIREMKK